MKAAPSISPNVSGKLAQEIVQAKPWTCREEEAFLNFTRTHEHLVQCLAEFFRPYNLSNTRYNMLRILRGAGLAGLSCSEAARRMISNDPDVTRLFDRLEARALIERSRSTADRRVVQATITASGLDLLASIDDPIREFHIQRLASLGSARLEDLIEVCEKLRP